MKISFATLAISPFWEEEACLLAKSLRIFGGSLSQSPLTALSLKDQPLSQKTRYRCDQLSVELTEFEVAESALKFPLGLVPFGAAAAEAHFKGQTDVLVWLLPDALILNPPIDFELPRDKVLAYRPVHHQNIGSSFDQPLDDFWKLIYQHTDVSEDHVFPMETCYREVVRPYFNAGILAVRPEFGILRQWAETFERTFQHPDFLPLFENQRMAVFMHQAVLAGLVLNRLKTEMLACLPEGYNYPLHMHEGYPKQGKINKLADLVSARYENVRELPGFLSLFEDASRIESLLAD